MARNCQMYARSEYDPVTGYGMNRYKQDPRGQWTKQPSVSNQDAVRALGNGDPRSGIAPVHPAMQTNPNNPNAKITITEAADFRPDRGPTRPDNYGVRTSGVKRR